MLHSKARWTTAASDSPAAEQLAAQLNIHPAVARLLVARGMTTVEEADRFLNGGKDHVHDPFLLDGMDAAVARIRQALQNGEKIRVYGDYDADGVSSTALMTQLLRMLGANFDTYIPHRMLEGYGLNNAALDAAREAGVSLLITVDTGISAVEQVAYATQLGLEVIVTDHHEPPEQLPDAYAIINPKKPGCPYPNKQLAGVGVAWKLAHALLGDIPEELAEYAALGTVADLMPLLGENRCIVKLGLSRLAATRHPGFQALFGVCSLAGKEITATHLGFSLAPRINASGRLQHAGDALRLLTTDDLEEAERLAEQLDRLNKERQRIVDEMTDEALRLLEAEGESALRPVIVVAREGWNTGVIGIVAARLLERFYRPVIVLSIDAEKGIAKGSARSIAGYDIHRALSKCDDLLDHYGGHQAAGGMTLAREAIGAFGDRLNELAEDWLNEDDFVPVLQVDAEFALDEVSVDSIRQIEALAPFGMGNPSPRVQLSGLAVQDMRLLGKEKQHLKLQLAQSMKETAATVEAVGFGWGPLTELLSPTAKVDLIGELSINEWNGVRKPQLLLQDMRVGELQVFDWRGQKRLAQKLGELDGSRSAAGKISRIAPSRRALVIESSYHWRRERKLVEAVGWPIYGWDAERGVVPLDAAAEEVSLVDVTDLVLYSLPNAEVSLHRVLKAAASVERIYPVFADWNTDDWKLPARETFKKVYALLLHTGRWSMEDDRSIGQFASQTGLSPETIRFILVVFEELAFVERSGSWMQTVPQPARAELESAPSYRERQVRLAMESALIYSTAQELTDWITKKRLDFIPLEVPV